MFTCNRFNCLHKESSNAVSPLMPQHKQLLDFCSMQCIGLCRKLKLDGTNHLCGVTCNQKHTFLLRNVFQDSSPVLSCLLLAQRRKKTDRGTACYRILKKGDEF